MRHNNAAQPMVPVSPVIPDTVPANWPVTPPTLQPPRPQSPDDAGASSMKGLTRLVARLVEAAGETTYGEVVLATSKELAKSAPTPTFSAATVPTLPPPAPASAAITARDDLKNVRRRVYDILSVLASLGVVGRRERNVVWNGFPDAVAQPPRDNLAERQEAQLRRELQTRIREKREALQRAQEANELLQGLAERNIRMEQLSGAPASKVPLPFILLASEKGAQVDLQTADNTHEILFQFNKPFEVFDDAQTTRMLNLSHQMQIPNTTLQQSPNDLDAFLDSLSDSNFAFSQEDNVGGGSVDLDDISKLLDLDMWNQGFQ